MTLTPAEKITRAKCLLYETQPFFSFIVNNMDMIEKTDEKFWRKGNEKEVKGTMAVDKRGTLYYHPDFVAKLDDEELKGVLCHEAMHCALLHLTRINKKDMRIWNYATDMVINNALVNTGFRLPKEGILPSDTNEFEIKVKPKPRIIKDVDKKIAESIYNELYDIAEKLPQQGFDIHISDDNQDGDKKNGASEAMGDLEDKWKQVLTDATYFAKQKGNLPGSMERIVDKILNKKLNWKQMLYRFITNEVQYDFTYARPSRKFISTGIYFPNISRENIKITAAIDTSGSIGQKELGLFLGEIYKITKSFNNIELEVLFHDTQISSKHKFSHGNLNRVLTLKPTGGGGTSHKEVFEYVSKNKTNILICFTDGYSDIPECKKFNNTIFVLTDENIKTPFGRDIYFDKNNLD